MTLPLRLLKSGYRQAVLLWRDYSLAGRQIARKRIATDRLLDHLGRTSTERFEGTVLVDGMWDNPNYWVRYSLLRSALGLAHGREVGLTGEFRERHVAGTMSTFGFHDKISFHNMPISADVAQEARRLVEETRSPADVLAWNLPGDVHPTIIYDGILKRQRLATLDVTRADFLPLVADLLAAIAQAQAVLDRVKPDIVIISHPFNFTYGSLTWLALSRGIPVVLPYGLFGMCRFVRFTLPEHQFTFYDRPTREEIDNLPARQAEAMAAVGRRYVEARLGGRADDIAALFAFKRNAAGIDREGLCVRSGWNPETPITAFYSSNWFDWPHQLGMTQFRDFLDWTEATFEVAAANRNVNWLFKPHPAEDWFGGTTLADVLAKIGHAPNIAIAEKDWNGAEVMRAVDAMVTYHGTAGVEFAALGKPVMVPDRGKYEDCGFVKLARSRSDYLQLLSRDWWSDMDLIDTKRRAEIFAGWWFCAPEKQGGFVLSDDAVQDRLYDQIPELLAEHPQEIADESAMIRDWWKSGHRYYHTRKMIQANTFRLTNVA